MKKQKRKQKTKQNKQNKTKQNKTKTEQISINKQTKQYLNYEPKIKPFKN